MASSSSSTTAAHGSRRYDVFISFRGEDTRNTITGILHGRLYREYHVNVFMDDRLHKGDEISLSLMNAIEESTISVVVFSEGYASSRWCLEELIKIIECRKVYGQTVVPVFFCVDPSDIRNQIGTFGNGFTKLVESFNKEKLEKLQMTEEQFKEKVQAWRNAMTEAANLTGYTVTGDSSLYGLSQKIAGDILEILNYLSSEVDNSDLVGIEPTVDFIIKYLLGFNDNYELIVRKVRPIGIWGMGGMGKTTIAKAVFNKVRTKFEASYFALNVREKSSNTNTLAFLREELLSAVLNCSHITYSTKKRLGNQKVLMVFDDVTSFNQIESLIGDLNCLSLDSCVIITTRDRQVLRNCGVHESHIYKIEGLSDCKALQLFSRHAFRQDHPKIDYSDLSKRVIQYAKGVPLALKVLGSFLLGKPKEVWESAINKLEIIPHADIQKVLKISYDELDDIEKNIFLDIACFLKWENRDFATDFLDACGFYAKFGISVLIDKCLVTMSNDNKITMHDLLQEMGWEIVRQESTRDPGERSRLWHYKDICSVLEENAGTKAVEGISFDMSKEREVIHLQPHAFKKMRKLRFFKLHNSRCKEDNINKVHVTQGVSYISTELRYFCWHGCPLKSFPTKFHPKNLFALDMPYSNIEQLWTTAKLVNLKHVDFSYSKHLRNIEVLSLAPNLESLVLEGCTSLFEIPSSIQNLHKLVILNLKHCGNLRSLPTGFCTSQSLRKVFLSFCSNLRRFPDISCNIEELLLDETAIEQMPTSIENLSRLVTLDLKNCSMLSSLPVAICNLKSLEHLNISGCSNLDGLSDILGNLEALKVLKAERVFTREILSSIISLHFLMELNLTNCHIMELPSNLGQLSSLESLLLGRNNFESIPTSIKDLPKLSYLDLSYCKRLQSLPELPSQLQSIDAHNCILMKASSTLSTLFSRIISQGGRVNFSNCFKLVDQTEFHILVNDALELGSIKKMIKANERFCSCVSFPGNEYPECCLSESTGSLLTFELRYISATLFNGLIMCAIVEFQNYHNHGQSFAVGYDCMITSWNRQELCHGTLRSWNFGTGPYYIDSDHIFLGSDCLRMDFDRFTYSESCTITIQFFVENSDGKIIDDCCKVSKCGVYCQAQLPFM